MVQQSVTARRVVTPAAPSKYRKWIIGLVALCVVGGGIAWGVRYQILSAQTARVEELRQQLASAEKLSEQERRELWEQMRDEMKKLPEAERDRLREQGRQQFQQQMEKRIHEVLSLPPAQRTAALDKQIDEFERRRKESEARRAERGRQPGSGPANGGGGSQGDGARGGGPPPGGPGAQSDNRGGGGGGNNYQDPNARRRQRLSQTSPEQRAEMAEYRRLMTERRKQRGLPEVNRRF